MDLSRPRSWRLGHKKRLGVLRCTMWNTDPAVAPSRLPMYYLQTISVGIQLNIQTTSWQSALADLTSHQPHAMRIQVLDEQ